jgi:hypothetical protein
VQRLRRSGVTHALSFDAFMDCIKENFTALTGWYERIPRSFSLKPRNPKISQVPICG